MPKYFYIVRDRAGKKDSGFEDANSEEEAISRLQTRGLIVISISPAFKEPKVGLVGTPPIAGTPRRAKAMHRGVRQDDLVLLCRQLATLLGAGATILKSLDIIGKQIASRKLYNVLRDLQRLMEQGLSLHEAMAKHPTVFSELWVNLSESGEASGNLPLVLTRLATYLERNASFRKKLISAMMYPAVLMCAGLGALLFLTIKIIPTFAQLFQGFNVKMPFLTQVLIDVSKFIRGSLIFIIAGLIGGFFLFRQYLASKEGRRRCEGFLYNLPMLGDFFRALVVERFTSEMYTLVESGVPILYSLEIAEHSVGSVLLGGIVRKVKEDVRDGRALSQSLEKSGFFDSMAVQMVNIGEEIGELANMFKRLNDFYQEYVDTFLTRFTALFEPLMLVFMGAVIGIMVIGMFLPIFQIAQMGGQ